MTNESEAAQLFEELYPPLAGWCRGLVDSDALAHEIASEAFTRLWSRWSRVDDTRAYLFAVAANLVKDHWRRQERDRRATRLVRDAERDAGPPRMEHAQEIREIVQALPKKLRIPVLLYYYADLPVAQIATALGHSTGTIKSDLHRARELLRWELRDLREIT
ncbi:RNA polymerase sigma factor [Streptomyces sp. NPDC054784]